MDRLLRSGRFVNLHVIVRQALRAGVESYSIKQLEPFYGYTREMNLHDAAPHRRLVELALESNAMEIITDDARRVVEAYNRDDCRSALALRDWLERLRADIEAGGTLIARPEQAEGEAPESVSELERQVEALRPRLLEGIPAEGAERRHVPRPMRGDPRMLATARGT